jgi:hypothetical protein
MASPVPLARRLFLTGAATILCQACGDTWTKGIPQAARTYVLKGEDLTLTRDDVTRIPYASIAVRFSNNAQSLLILARYEGDDLHWISTQREVLVTRHGRLVKTYGLPNDIRDTHFMTADPVGKPIAADAMQSDCLRTIDLEPRHVDGIVIRSRFENAGREELTILDAKLATELWIESNVAPDLDWSFTNRFWIDAGSGYVWKSQQYLSPGLPPLEIIVYRPAAQT